MGNYTKDDTDKAHEEVLDAEAIRQDIGEELGVFPLVDQHMDHWQEEGYRILRDLEAELRDKDPYSASRIRDALGCFKHAENLESINEGHVASSAIKNHRQGRPIHRAINLTARKTRQAVGAGR